MQLWLADGVAYDWLPVPAGDFVMGSRNELFYESPPRRIVLATGFLLGRCAVTQAQWQAVMEHNPSLCQDSPEHPVDNVSWDDAIEFSRRVQARTGQAVRLPTEAEWEYACRAGTTSDFFFGDWGPFLDDSEIPWDAAQCLCDYAWFELNSEDQTHAVGQKRPNPWGFHDLIGNTWEWCADVWHDNYRDGPLDGSAWMQGAAEQQRRCLRGGAWDMNAFRCRSSYRSFDYRQLGTNRFGLRLALSPAEPLAAAGPLAAAR